MANLSRTYAVIGLGTFGSTVATELAEFGNYVLGIDCADGPVAALAETIRDTVIADARDEKALREAGVGQCEVAVVAIGGDLEANIVCAMNLKLIGVETIWAKAFTRTHHRILARLDVNRVVHVEREMGQRVAQVLHNPLVRDYVSLGNGFYAITMTAPEKMAGRTLSALNLTGDRDVRCLEAMRGSESLMTGDTDPEIEEGDRLLVLGRREALREFSDNL